MVVAAHEGQSRTGIAGLDEILAGGFERGRVFLVEGSPGTGKTTIATQFLLAGAAAGERTLYITLSENEDELRAGAASHGWDLSGVDVFELVPPESLLDENQQQSLLYSSDLELGRDHPAHLRGLRAREAAPGRARQPVRDQAAGPELPALPAADPEPQALLRPAGRDRPPARRPHHGPERQDRSLDRPRRRPPRGEPRPSTAPSGGACG